VKKELKAEDSEELRWLPRHADAGRGMEDGGSCASAQEEEEELDRGAWEAFVEAAADRDWMWFERGLSSSGE
jgi:hypothetical protein